MSSLSLITRFLQLRWADTVSDLVEKSVQSSKLMFDDLDLAMDLKEISRAVNRGDFQTWAQSILNRECDIKEFFLDNEPLESDAHSFAFLELMAINVVMLMWGIEAADWVVNATLTQSAMPLENFDDFVTFVRRCSPPQLAKKWADQHFAEISQGLDWQQPSFSRPDHYVLHADVDIKTLERSLRKVVESSGHCGCRTDDERALLWSIVLPRVGRSVQAMLRGDEELVKEVARALSEKNVLADLTLVDGRGPRLEIIRFKNGRKVSDTKPYRVRWQVLCTKYDVDFELTDDDMLGLLVSEGFRVYDPGYPKSLSNLLWSTFTAERDSDDKSSKRTPDADPQEASRMHKYWAFRPVKGNA